MDRLAYINPTTGEVLQERNDIFVYPAVHYVMPEERIKAATDAIEAELNERVAELRAQGKLLEAQRLLARTKYDLEMMLEVGYCHGIENYTRHLNKSEPGAKPYTLVDYFPDDYLLIIDESHVSVSQIGAMYGGDRSRKEVLVEHGFRLPSCLDNRPMRFEEFENMWSQALFVSATPGDFEFEQCGGEVVEQVIRPTGLVDPEIETAAARGQVPDLIERCQQRVAAGERVLVTTLTKRLAEDLSNYIQQAGMRCRYLHSEIDTLERVEILRDLRGACPLAIGERRAGQSGPGFADALLDRLRDAGLPAHSIEVELTERVLMSDAATVEENISVLVGAGISLSVDDFGTGYSSLSYLRRFPLRRLKLDKRFVDGQPENVDNVAISRAVLAMAHSLDMDVVAEGVEDAVQARFLVAEGVDVLQGWLYAAAMPRDALARWCSQRAGPAALASRDAV